jgi:hypothetical protein
MRSKIGIRRWNFEPDRRESGTTTENEPPINRAN